MWAALDQRARQADLYRFGQRVILQIGRHLHEDRLGKGATAEARTPVIAVPVKPCHATIVAPLNSATVSRHGVVFQGQGYYREEQKPEFHNLQWTSSIDGNLGSGPSLAKKLSPGTHTITLTAGTPDRAGTAQVTVTAL